MPLGDLATLNFAELERRLRECFPALARLTSEQHLENWMRQRFGDALTRRAPVLPVAVTADLPDAAEAIGSIFVVPDGGPGATVQASDGTAWVALG